MRLPLPPTPFHVLTPFLKQAQSEGWTPELCQKLDKRLPKIGQWSVVELMLSKGYQPTPIFMTQSAAIGDLEFLSMGRSRGFPCEPIALKASIENGRVESVQFLFQYYPEFKTHFSGRELLDFSLCRRYNRDGWYCIQQTGWVDMFKYLAENGFRKDIEKTTISWATLIETMKAERTHDYSFGITSYLYQEKIIDDQKVLVILEMFNTAKQTCEFINFRKLFEVRPDFRKICYDNNLTNYPYLFEKGTRIKEVIEEEKEGSKILETSLPTDVIRYVIWNYL